MNTKLRALQKEQALLRMANLKINRTVTNEFNLAGQLNRSEQFGVLYWLSEEEQKIVTAFEEKNQAVVYHCLLNNYDFGRVFSMLYVGKDKDEWEKDLKDTEAEGEFSILARCENLDDPSCSEFGYIGIKRRIGGLHRVS